MTSIVRDLDDVPTADRVVTIGFFDGVHRGHRSIIRRALRATRHRRAGGQDVSSAIVTFDRHPMAVVRPESVPPLITPHERRFELLAATAGDLVVVLPFDEQMAGLEPGAFVDDILVDRLGVREVVIGSNFRFGRRAAGDTGTLEELGRGRGFEVDAVPLLHLAGVPISSTAVREHVGRGEVEWAARALARPYAVEGEVVAGDRRGRQLGVPTANVRVGPGELVPANGVYAGFVHVDEQRVPGATSVGVRPTFDGREVTVEAHLIGWGGDLYGRRIRVELRHRLRDEERYDDVDELVAQMERDIEDARRLLDHPGR